MPAPPPPPRAQTIKQARAAYRARGQPTVSDTERRQLQREAELDRRALRVREAEKRKTEAAKKRAEKEREAREAVRLGTQVKFDKFGKKSSQMHLGAFLNKPGLVKKVEQKENVDASAHEFGEEEDFEDSDMDDATLLDALDGTSDNRRTVTGFSPLDAGAEASIASVIQSSIFQDPAAPVQISAADDFASFFEDFGTSTQIARELNADEHIESIAAPQPVIAGTLVGTPDFDDFDLTVEDLEAVEPPPAPGPISHPGKDRKLMPPPPLPLNRAMPAISFDSGFTISELEQYVDDDLQLTQCDPG